MWMRRYHRLFAYVLLLPFIVWSLTALFFLFRPAYQQAYAPLLVATQPNEQVQLLRPESDWLEYRVLHTELGGHLLVRKQQGWEHRRIDNAALWPLPPREQQRRLVSAAMAADPRRYGELLDSEGEQFETSTGVLISLDWNTLSLRQNGPDTRWIDWVYNLHYLRWTGVGPLDDLVGALGLLLLILMTATGGTLLLRQR